MENSRIKQSSKNIVFSLLNKIVMLVVPFIVRTVLIYTLGVNYVGLNGLFSSVLAVLSLAELGFGSALVVNMYKPVADNDKESICKILGYYKKIYLCIGTIILIAGVVTIPFLHYFIEGDIPSDINLYLLFIIYLLNTVISYLFFGYRNALFVSSQRNDIVSKISTICNLGLYGLQILVLLLFKNYYAYVILLPIITLANNLISYFISKKMYPDIVCKKGIDNGVKKDVLDKTKFLIGHKIGGIVANSFDSIIISAFLGLTILGQYNNYYYIVSGIFGLISAMTSVVVPSVANSIIKRDLESNLKDFKTFNFYIQLINVVFCACLFCLYQPFVKMWVGEENMLSLAIVALMTLYFFVNCSRQIVMVYKDALGLWKEDWLRPYIEALVNLILNIVLVQFMGLEGVVIATIISMGLVTLPWESVTLYRNFFKVSSRNYFLRLVYNFLIMIIGVGICYLLCSFVLIEGILGLLIKAIISLSVSLLVFLIGYFWTSGFKDAINFFKRVKNQFTKKES